ncbi:MAG: hypothetical protein AB1414_20840, partial [bacterium]
MDMYSRNQYLKELRKDYLKTKSKKEKGKLLDEAQKRTELERKYLIKKLKPKSNLDKRKEERKKRKVIYDGYFKVALIRVWEVLDYPCGQRLEPSLRETNIVDKLRELKELVCSDEVAKKLKKICAKTVDTKLRHEKEVIHQLQRKGQPRSTSLLLKKIPIKIHGELDNQQLGNIQIDYVEHCGSSAAGEFVCTIDCPDIASGWEEWEAVMGRGQIPTKEGLDKARNRSPFEWKEIHSDTDKGFVNAHLVKYSEETNLRFSRSRPYRKNDNCYVEQKNWFSIRKRVGYLRFDTEKERDLLNDLYRNELRLYKNFFLPRMKLKEKIRIGAKVYRKYYPAKTPYQYLMESDQVPEEKKKELKEIYLSLNPAELKRAIEAKLDNLYKVYQRKQRSAEVIPFKRLRSRLVSNYITEQDLIRCH